MEADGVGGRVSDDPRAKIATFRGFQAGDGALDPGVEEGANGGAATREFAEKRAFDRAAEVGRTDESAGRITDPLAQPERVRGAAVRQSGKLSREVRHQPRTLTPADITPSLM